MFPIGEIRDRDPLSSIRRFAVVSRLASVPRNKDTLHIGSLSPVYVVGTYKGVHTTLNNIL